MALLLKKWKTLEEMKNVLHVPYLCTVLLQKEDMTLSDMFGCLQIMELKLNHQQKNCNKQSIIAEKMLDSLNKRKQKLLMNPLMICAIYLDPRYKCSIDNDTDEVVLAKLTLTKIYSQA